MTGSDKEEPVALAMARINACFHYEWEICYVPLHAENNVCVLGQTSWGPCICFVLPLIHKTSTCAEWEDQPGMHCKNLKLKYPNRFPIPGRSIVMKLHSLHIRFSSEYFHKEEMMQCFSVWHILVMRAITWLIRKAYSVRNVLQCRRARLWNFADPCGQFLKIAIHIKMFVYGCMF